MANKRTHIVLPADVIAGIDEFVGKRGRSKFLGDLASREVRRLRLLKVLDELASGPKPKPDLRFKNGSAAWVSKMRLESEKRFRRETRR